MDQFISTDKSDTIGESFIKLLTRLGIIFVIALIYYTCVYLVNHDPHKKRLVDNIKIE